MKRLSIKVKKGGQIEIVTESVPKLEMVEALIQGLKARGVIMDTPSPNPALQLILCG